MARPDARESPRLDKTREGVKNPGFQLPRPPGPHPDMSAHDPHALPIPFPKPASGSQRRPRVPIFLDFEGVLKTAGSPTRDGFPLARNLLPALERAEALCLSPQVVIASSYRQQLSVGSLAQILDREAPGLGRFVTSATPSEPSMRLDRQQREAHGLAPRLFEVRAWLAREGMADSRWIAIDDNPSLYGAESSEAPAELMVCDPEFGLDAERASELAERLLRIARAAAPSSPFAAPPPGPAYPAAPAS